jgi:hypothetical protein
LQLLYDKNEFAAKLARFREKEHVGCNRCIPVLRCVDEQEQSAIAAEIKVK